MRFARAKDGPHAAIVRALKAAGALVHVLEQATWCAPGHAQQVAGAPDLLVCWGRVAGRLDVTLALEVKSPGGKVSPAQEAYRRCAEGHGLRCYVVTTPLEALALLPLTTSEVFEALVVAGSPVAHKALAAEMTQARERLGVVARAEPRGGPCVCGHLERHHDLIARGSCMGLIKRGQSHARCPCTHFAPSGPAEARVWGIVPTGQAPVLCAAEEGCSRGAVDAKTRRCAHHLAEETFAPAPEQAVPRKGSSRKGARRA